MARIVRSFIIPTYENALLWHEARPCKFQQRALHALARLSLAEDVMAKTTDVLTNMWVDKERCLANIHAQKGLVMAEKVMIELVDHGVPRDEATVLREASFTAWPAGKN